MKENLSFGSCLNEKAKSYEYIYDMEAFFPSDHRFLIDLSTENARKALTKLASDLTAYVKEPKAYDMIIDEIKHIHPYFMIEDNAIACFNCTIAKLLTNESLDSQEQKQQYFESLMYHDLSNHTDITYWASLDCSINYDVLPFQRRITRLLGIVFDDSPSNLSTLPISTRYAFCCSAFSFNGISDIQVRFGNAKNLIDVKNHPDISSEYDTYISCLQESNSNNFDIPDSFRDKLSELEIDTGAVFNITYLISSFTKLIELEIHLMLRDDVRLNRCKKCGLLFAIEEQGQEYCNHPKKNGETCLSKAKYIFLKESLSKYYQISYKKHFKRVSQNTESQEVFNKWKIDMQKLKKAILSKEYEYSLSQGNPFD